MSIRTILAAVSGGSASTGALDLGCRFARRFAAHVEGYHVLVDPRAVFAAAGEGFDLALSGGLIEQIMDESAATAGKTRALFDAVVAKHGLPPGNAPPAPGTPPVASAGWREETGHAPTLVSGRARFFDLAVLGRSDRVIHEPHTHTIEETLVRSGRPVLIAPAQPPAEIGNAVAVAWNGSPQSVRGLAAALPFLAGAKSVSLVTIGDADAGGSLSALEYLGWHGIAAQPRHLGEPAGSRIGAALLDAARQAGADLLVMGGFGHAPWREVLFGGATREAIGAAAIPLLLMH